MKRNIIRIDEDKCTGCGLCITNCAEGSLEIRNGKAVLVKESLCDGLGACIGHCPEGALTIEVRDADEFDECQVEERLKEIGREPPKTHTPHVCPSNQPKVFGGCPSSKAFTLNAQPAGDSCSAPSPSALGTWPVQLGLLSPAAPFFDNADLLLTADCVPFAYAGFHKDFLPGKVVAVACPKLDDAQAHYERLLEIFKRANIKSVTALRMEVPCCGGLIGIAKKAIADSGKNIPFKETVISRDGKIL